MYSSLLRSILLTFSAGLWGLATAPARAQEDNSNIAAFSAFIEKADYAGANMYITGGFVRREEVDTTQIFVQTLMKVYAQDLGRNAQAIDGLYQYLASIAPLDFNRTVECSNPQSYSNQRHICTLATNLMTGAKRETVAYFLERGLDLNFKANGVVPASVPMMMRMGSVYQIDDLNYFVSKGFTLGADRYSVSELTAFQDNYLSEYNHGSRSLNVPLEQITVSELNLLDLLVIVLGSRHGGDDRVEAKRVGFICEFITYAAPSFQASFDYLEYILQARDTFRQEQIGKMVKGNSRSGAYEVFPASCVALVKSMTASHGNIQKIINTFAAKQEVNTANWLMRLRSETP